MTELLSRIFVKDYKNVTSPAVRRSYGTMASVVGIIVNLLLFTGKLTVGTLSGAISITADAFNNLSDAGSQIISLVSFCISAKPADRDHPFGHARIEYVASMIVSFLVLLVGFELMKTSVEKLLEPEPVEVSAAAIAVMAASVAFKVWLGAFNRHLGRKTDSPAFNAVAVDSMSDCVATSVVIACLLIYKHENRTTHNKNNGNNEKYFSLANKVNRFSFFGAAVEFCITNADSVKGIHNKSGYHQSRKHGDHDTKC